MSIPQPSERLKVAADNAKEFAQRSEVAKADISMSDTLLIINCLYECASAICATIEDKKQ